MNPETGSATDFARLDTFFGDSMQFSLAFMASS
jgi:hypothetical protein